MKLVQKFLLAGKINPEWQPWDPSANITVNYKFLDDLPYLGKTPLTNVGVEIDRTAKMKNDFEDAVYYSDIKMPEKAYDILLDPDKRIRIMSNPDSKAHTGYIHTNVWDTLAYHLGRNPEMSLTEGFGLAERESGTGRERSMNGQISADDLLSAWGYTELDPVLALRTEIQDKSIRNVSKTNDRTNRKMDILDKALNENLNYIDKLFNECDSLITSGNYDQLDSINTLLDKTLDKRDSLYEAQSEILNNELLNTEFTNLKLYESGMRRLPLARKMTKRINNDLYNWAFLHYLKGLYNPGDPDYMSKVRKDGEELLKTKEWKHWWETSGKYWYDKGRQSKSNN